RVGPVEVGHAPDDHLPRRADQGFVVEADEVDVAGVAVLQAGADGARVEADGPGGPLHTADAHQGCVLQPRRLVQVADPVVHDPDGRVADLQDLVGGPGQDAHEDRHLLRHQEGGEADAEDQPQILASVAGQHPQRDPVHGPTPPSRVAGSGWFGAWTPLSIPRTTRPKMVAFHDLGSSRVATTVNRLSQPATTLVRLPSFFRAISTTAPGSIAIERRVPDGQSSVRVGPGHTARTEMPFGLSSLAIPSAKGRT